MLIAKPQPDKLSCQNLKSGSVTARPYLHPFRQISAIATLVRQFAAALLLVGMFAGQVGAGLSPMEVVVVVNAGSLNSRTLANHYVALRGIPAINVVVLEEVPNSEVIPVADFRSRILRPLLAELERRKIRNHIHCVAYSADFPTAIDISADLKKVEGLHQLFTPVGSINSLTYLYAQVLAEEPSYIGLNTNFYARREIKAYFENPGGAGTQAVWSEIQQHMEAGEHAAAADDLEKLLAEHPHQFPLAYLAAAQAAQAGDKPRAIELLRQAVAKGWTASRYLKNDARFDALRQDSDFQIIELSLDEGVKELQPAIGFDALQAWTPNGVPVGQPQFGLRYLLSTVLGVTRGSGTSLPEAIEILRRAATADFTHPEGSFYFSSTDDVRTTTRQWGFIGAVDDLQQLGFQAEIISSVLPRHAPRVLGLQLGAANFAWAQSDSQFVPGAIADNLTSLGGVMTSGAGQTNLSELLKAGAAGSSGAVTEPYALQAKFPHPNMYVVYARGASLAEAFYLSVTGPYQLLIVGDPLCQPFAHAPKLEFNRELRKLDVDQPLQLDLKDDGLSYDSWLESSVPLADRSQRLAAIQLRMLLDGVIPHQIPKQSTLKVATRGISLGYHELTLQAIAEGPFAFRSEGTLPFWVGSADTVDLILPEAEPSSEYDRQISLRKGNVVAQVNSSAGQRVSLWHDAEELAVASGANKEFTLQLDMLGMGPVRLQAKAELADGTLVASRPLWLNVLP